MRGKPLLTVAIMNNNNSYYTNNSNNKNNNNSNNNNNNSSSNNNNNNREHRWNGSHLSPMNRSSISPRQLQVLLSLPSLT